ncbi:MAG: permease [bacterium]
MFQHFTAKLLHYAVEVAPALLAGFFISGLINEFVPSGFVNRYLNRKGILPIFYVTLAGIILPVCCIGSLPIAVGLRKKGVSLGPILAFLVATPATSVSAVLVAWRLMGLGFTLYLSGSVIIMGLIIGIIGNNFSAGEGKTETETCPSCASGLGEHNHPVMPVSQKIRSIFLYSFVEQPREMGIEIAAGLVLAAAVASITPVGNIINTYLHSGLGYIFALFFGMIMYICSTASVPLAAAFVNSGMNPGAGIVLLLVGPITSYSTILVLKKEFGAKILFLYLAVISAVSLISGFVYNYIAG